MTSICLKKGQIASLCNLTSANRLANRIFHLDATKMGRTQMPWLPRQYVFWRVPRNATYLKRRPKVPHLPRKFRSLPSKWAPRAQARWVVLIFQFWYQPKRLWIYQSVLQKEWCRTLIQGIYSNVEILKLFCFIMTFECCQDNKKYWMNIIKVMKSTLNPLYFNTTRFCVMPRNFLILHPYNRKQN